MISTDVIVRNVKDLLPIKCAGINGKKVVCGEKELIASAKLCVGNSIPNIGAEINKASSMFCKMNEYKENTPQYLEMERRLIQAVKITQSVIDMKKSSKCFKYPKEWLSSKAVEALEDGEYKDLCRELIADKKPYFMMFRYDKEKKEYMDKFEEFNTKALINFGKTLDEVLNSDNRTEREQLLVDLFMQQIPFYYDNTTMFRVATIAEEMLKEVKYTTKTDNSTKELLKSDVIATKEQKKAIKELFMDMCSEMSAVHQQDMSCLSLDERREARLNIVQEIKDKYYYIMLDSCNGDRDICLNCLIDVIYSSNKSATMLWEYFSDVITENLLKRNDYKVNTMTEDVEGNIEYLGKHYSIQTVRVEK